MSQKASAVPSGQVPFWECVAWGVGGASENLIASGLTTLALSIYNIGMGVSAVWIGMALSVPRILDTFLNPMVGSLSDNTRTRLGRRRPWMIAGVILASLTFALVWRPPLDWNVKEKWAWFAVLAFLYYLFYDFFAISYNALGMELSDDYRERTRIQSFRTFFIVISGLGVSWLYKLCFHPWFTGPPVAGVHPEVMGVRRLSILYALAVLAIGLIPVLFCRERERGLAQTRIKLLESLRLTFSNGVFWLFVGMMAVSLVGVVMCVPLASYLLIFYVCQGDKSFAGTLTGFGGTISVLTSIFAIPLIRLTANRIGKRNALFVGQALVCVGALASWFYFDPAHPWAALFAGQMLGVGIIFFTLLSNSILADICDLDDLRTSHRREGVFTGVFAFINKTTYALGTLFSGYMVTWAGFHGGDNPGPATVHALRLMYALIPPCFALAGAALTLLFPLTARYAAEVREQIEARNAARAADPQAVVGLQ